MYRESRVLNEYTNQVCGASLPHTRATTKAKRGWVLLQLMEYQLDTRRAEGQHTISLTS